MSVYDDVQALQAMFEYCYDAETGEVDEGAEKQLAEYKAEILSADLEKLCKVRVNLMAKAEAIKDEKDRLAARQKVAEKEVERINSTILFALKNTGKDKVTAGTFTVSTRKSSQLIVDEDNFKDDRFIEKVFTQKIDKMAIKQAIKQGEVIDGCQIKEVENLQVK